MTTRPILLALQGVSARYDAQLALQDIELLVEPGESVAIAGANGAGKSTLFATIAGLAVPSRRNAGTLQFEGRSYDLARHGPAPGRDIALVPERDKVFTLLTVEENIEIGLAPCRRSGAALTAQDAYDWFPRLHERRHALAGNLSGGEQQMLGIALALLSRPRLLLLDEPTLGLAVPIIETLCERLAALRRDLGLTILVAESDTQWLPALAQRAVVLAYGRVVDDVPALGPAQLDAIHDIMLGLAPGRHQEATA